MPPAAHIPTRGYRRRNPEAEPLYQILAEHLETFLQQARSSDHRLPLHVEQEMRAYLECGVLPYGFMRVRCEDCGHDRVVAFSCKKRGFCTSCAGRRMADTAARLVDNVLPRVPVRQFVLSFPYEIRYRLAWDGELIAAVLKVFLRVVGRWYRRQALGHSDGRCGSVTFVQRFGSSLNVNPHIHVLFLDGVYVDGDEGLEFIAAAKLGDDDVQQIVETTARRLIRLCTKRGLLDDVQIDTLADEEPVLAAITAASVRGFTATGERAGQRLRRVLRDPATAVRTAPLCFAARGFSLHAATRIAAEDRLGLEKLCRYVARPALAAGRLRIRDDGQLSFALKTPWANGTTHLLLSPHELLEKLAALVPPPRLNLIRYHGILAANARDRDRIVPGVDDEPEATCQSDRQPCPRRLSWCQLLARVFAIDVTECPDCGGRMKIIAALTEPASIRSYLEGVGLPARPPPIAPARPAPQPELEFAA
jgi:ribosomal protein S27E